MQWKGTLPAGKVYSQPVIQLDYHATALAAAGALASVTTNLDGVDLLPYLTNKKSGPPHEALFWRYNKQWAIRSGNYKLAQFTHGSRKLFDLVNDISERHDIIADKPDIAEKLQRQWDAWNAQLQPPAWGKYQKTNSAAGDAKKDKTVDKLRKIKHPNFNQ
jgi:uncharacterized sulfatase